MENEENIQDAFDIYTESLKYKPTHSYLRKSIGSLHRSLGNNRKSINIYKELLKGNSLSAKYNMELAESYYADGNLEKALEYLKVAVDIWQDADGTYESA
ncbi:uncharacterized protein METZ01_LOCUS315753, partial [marine metagenome]